MGRYIIFHSAVGEVAQCYMHSQKHVCFCTHFAIAFYACWKQIQYNLPVKLNMLYPFLYPISHRVLILIIVYVGVKIEDDITDNLIRESTPIQRKRSGNLSVPQGNFGKWSMLSRLQLHYERRVLLLMSLESVACWFIDHEIRLDEKFASLLFDKAEQMLLLVFRTIEKVVLGKRSDRQKRRQLPHKFQNV